jgi:uncharacterized protein YihD (DUF1040 family)
MENVCSYIFLKYKDEFDSINEVYDIRDYLNYLYEQGGMAKVERDFFLPGATKEYKNDFKKLIRK